MMVAKHQDTIIAPATPEGVSALAVIRLSGDRSVEIVQRHFKGKDLRQQPSHTVHYGYLQEGDTLLDEVMVTLMTDGRSFTCETSVEITCHGSPLITQRILQCMIKSGARLAEPGEFSQRAYLNGRIDLTQVEAIADLIHAETESARQVALHQMRGGFSNELQRLRESLIHFAAMIELELDFSEEDVDFADRQALNELLLNLQSGLQQLIDSFAVGQVIKSGVPVVIAGRPNAGKSSLLNALFNEEKAIVSSIAGTTRDTIEDTLQINGILFRFIDTAGLRHTEDEIEAMGVERAKEKVRQAKIMLYLFDAEDITAGEILEDLSTLHHDNLTTIVVENKIDRYDTPSPLSKSIEAALKTNDHLAAYLRISTRRAEDIQQIKNTLAAQISLAHEGEVVITNLRHQQALQATLTEINNTLQGLADHLPNDLLAQHIKNAIQQLGQITGTIDVDRDILGTIFSKFCVGK